MTDSAHGRLAMTDIGQVVAKLRELRAQFGPAEQVLLDDLLSAAGVVETTPPQYNPFLPGVHADPYPHYHQIQLQNPVHWSEAMQAWVISGRGQVAEALCDRRLSHQTGYATIKSCVPEDEQPVIAEVGKLFGSLLNEIEPPDHTRLRRLMTRALANTPEPQRISRIRAIANTLIDGLQHAGHMDVVADFAGPLPAIVGADLLGIPVPDRERFAGWIENIVHTFSDGFSRTAAMLSGEAAVVELKSYLNDLVSERRVRPGHDVLSAMLRAPDVSDEDRVLVATNIAMGMHENLTHAISLSVNTLIRNPAVLHTLLGFPETIAIGVEEMLRHEGTAPIVSRIALEDFELGRIRIQKGQRVILLLAAADRDPECFPEPDRFILDRQPNPHIAFGVGKRACPGSRLARTVINAAVMTLVTRLPDMVIVDDVLKWREEINIHGLSSLLVKFDPRQAA
jgi:cytochrome P450